MKITKWEFVLHRYSNQFDIRFRLEKENDDKK